MHNKMTATTSLYCVSRDNLRSLFVILKRKMIKKKKKGFMLICPQVLYMCPTVLRLTGCFFTPKCKNRGDSPVKILEYVGCCKGVFRKGSFLEN